MSTTPETRTASDADTATSDCPVEQLADIGLKIDYSDRLRTERYRHVRLMRSSDLRNCWTHIHPGDDYSLGICVALDHCELYLVVPDMYEILKHHLGTGIAQTVVTTQGELGIWWLPIRSPGKTTQSSWNVSALEISSRHAGSCVRLHTVTGVSVYEAEVAEPDAAPAPEWPDTPLLSLLLQAFGRRVISSPDHPVAEALLAKSGGK